MSQNKAFLPKVASGWVFDGSNEDITTVSFPMGMETPTVQPYKAPDALPDRILETQ